MKPRDRSRSNSSDFDELDEKIHQALKEEGVIIPTTVEDVRRAKARLKARPITVPPHLREPKAVFDKINGAAKSTVMQDIKEVLLKNSESQVPAPRPVRAGGGEIIVPFCSTDTPRPFVEAVAISQLTRLISSPQFPLGPLRQNKLIYFAHRRVNENVQAHFLKQAAGPYSPWAKYQGPEKIAQENGYIKKTKVGVYSGFIVGENISKIDDYIARYPVCLAIEWVAEKFRYRKKDELELFSTVDFAVLDIIQAGRAVTREAIKNIIATNKNWAAKLDREIFCDVNIEQALTELRSLFPGTYPQ